MIIIWYYLDQKSVQLFYVRNEAHYYYYYYYGRLTITVRAISETNTHTQTHTMVRAYKWSMTKCNGRSDMAPLTSKTPLLLVVFVVFHSRARYI